MMDVAFGIFLLLMAIAGWSASTEKPRRSEDEPDANVIYAALDHSSCDAGSHSCDM